MVTSACVTLKMLDLVFLSLQIANGKRELWKNMSRFVTDGLILLFFYIYIWLK